MSTPDVMALEALWDRLLGVRWVRFCARSAAAVRTGWEGVGRGAVTVESLAEGGALMFRERGQFESSPGRTSTFTNVYRWSRLAGEQLRLEHLRFGPDHPVFLFDLAQRSPTQWASVEPHLCQHDCYSAELTLGEGELLLHWRVRGPAKDESIEYAYWGEDAGRARGGPRAGGQGPRSDVDRWPSV